MDGGLWAVEGGRWAGDGGRWTVGGGLWMVDGGRRAVYCECRLTLSLDNCALTEKASTYFFSGLSSEKKE